MMIHSVGDDIVYLDLTYDEHLALAHSLYSVMATIDPLTIPSVLGANASDAYEFVYSVYLIEAAATEAGVAWLQDDGCIEPMIPTAARPIFDVSFSDDSSTWRLTETQLAFVERAIKVWSEDYRTRREAA
jgi:hypothetical protein